MHSHSSRYLYVSALRRKVVEYLRQGQPVPSLLEWEATEAGINIDALREANS